jgi:hypothetical protein
VDPVFPARAGSFTQYLENKDSASTVRSPDTKSCSVLFESINVGVRLHSDAYIASYRNSGATNHMGPPSKKMVLGYF